MEKNNHSIPTKNKQVIQQEKDRINNIIQNGDYLINQNLPQNVNRSMNKGNGVLNPENKNGEYGQNDGIQSRNQLYLNPKNQYPVVMTNVSATVFNTP